MVIIIYCLGEVCEACPRWANEPVWQFSTISGPRGLGDRTAPPARGCMDRIEGFDGAAKGGGPKKPMAASGATLSSRCISLSIPHHSKGLTRRGYKLFSEACRFDGDGKSALQSIGKAQKQIHAGALAPSSNATPLLRRGSAAHSARICFKRIAGSSYRSTLKNCSLKPATIDYSDSGFLGGMIGGLSEGGGLVEGRNVAQVIPDSGSYWAVLPGIGGIRMRWWQRGH